MPRGSPGLVPVVPASFVAFRLSPRQRHFRPLRRKKTPLRWIFTLSRPQGSRRILRRLTLCLSLPIWRTRLVSRRLTMRSPLPLFSMISQCYPTFTIQPLRFHLTLFKTSSLHFALYISLHGFDDYLYDVFLYCNLLMNYIYDVLCCVDVRFLGLRWLDVSASLTTLTLSSCIPIGSVRSVPPQHMCFMYDQYFLCRLCRLGI